MVRTQKAENWLVPDGLEGKELNGSLNDGICNPVSVFREGI